MDQDNRRLVRAFPEQRFVFHFFEQPFYWEDSDMSIINNRVGEYTEVKLLSNMYISLDTNTANMYVRLRT